jgi:predicted enzyme related to lactoylglutathione lyase
MRKSLGRITALISTCGPHKEVRRVSIRRVVPNLASERLEKARAFYVNVLGFQVAMDLPINAGRVVTLVSPDNPTAQISLLSGRPSTSTQEPNLTIEVADVEAVHARAVAEGAQIVYPLTTEPWGVRRFYLTDPEGFIINVMSHPK